MDKSPLQSSRRPYSPRYKREWISRRVFPFLRIARVENRVYRVHILNYDGPIVLSQPRNLVLCIATSVTSIRRDIRHL